MPVEGRDLSSRQTQYVVKTWEIGQPINSAKGSETADGVAREANAGSLVREPDAGNLHVRFDERGVETESRSSTKAPSDERGGNRYVRPTATAPHLDSTKPGCVELIALRPLHPRQRNILSRPERL